MASAFNPRLKYWGLQGEPEGFTQIRIYPNSEKDLRTAFYSGKYEIIIATYEGFYAGYIYPEAGTDRMLIHTVADIIAGRNV